MPVMGSKLSQESRKLCGRSGAFERYLSIATLVRYGPTTSTPALMMMAARAIATCHLYGRRYPSSRFIIRLSYALPSSSCSCIQVSVPKRIFYRRCSGEDGGCRKAGSILKAFKKSQQLFPSYRGEAFKKIVDRFTRLQIFK